MNWTKEKKTLTLLLFLLELLLTPRISEGVSEGRCDMETRGNRAIFDPFGGSSDGRLALLLGGIDGLLFT